MNATRAESGMQRRTFADLPITAAVVMSRRYRTSLKRGEGFEWPKPCSHRTLRELIRWRSLLSRDTIAL